MFAVLMIVNVVVRTIYIADTKLWILPSVWVLIELSGVKHPGYQINQKDVSDFRNLS